MFKKKSGASKSPASKSPSQLTESESTWAEIFPETPEQVRVNQEDEGKQSLRFMKKCAGLCVCPKCVEDLPIDHEFPVEKFSRLNVESPQPAPPLFKNNSDLITNVQTQASKQKPADSKVLVHGQGIPAHRSSFDETNLSELVKQKLSKNGFLHCKPIQAYGCQAILRGKNVAIIGAPKTGKTLTYVSAFCSLLEEYAGEESLPKNRRSPAILVLAKDTSAADEIYRKLRALVNTSNSIWIASLPLDLKEISKRFSKNTPNIQLLIATPDCTKQLLHREIINFKRLCCVAVEDIDHILEKLQPAFNSIMELIESTLKQRKFFKGIQLVTCSQKWTKKLEGFLGTLDSFPLIIIGNSMQSALYSRTDFQLQYVKNNDKAKSLIILICTDSVIHSYLSITDVNILIHYTLPRTWTQFASRFTLMLDTYQCPLATAFKEERLTCKTMIFVDETTIECFLRIAYFFTDNKIEVPTALQDHCKKLEEKWENSNIEKNVPLCAELKTFGCCSQQKCTSRHKFAALDKCESEEILTGLMRGKLIVVKDVNCFYMRVDSVKLSDGKFCITNAAKHLTTIDEALERIKILELATSISVGNKYIYHHDNDKFRCIVEEIVEFLKVGDLVSNIPSKVRISGLDNGLTAITSPDWLFEMDGQLADLPATATECIIAKLVPPFEEPRWTERALKMLQHELDFYNKSTAIIEANILLKSKSTIWVDDMFVKESKGKCHMYTSIRSTLKDKQFFAESEDNLAALFALWNQAGLSTPKYEILPFDMPLIRSKQAKPIWAHIKRDEINSLFLIAASGTNNIFLRHASFDKILKQLEQRISKSVMDGHKTLKTDQIQVGQVYALPDNCSSNWCRVLVLEIDGDSTTCLYVDYGDSVVASKHDLRLLNNHSITCFPFQAIECSLYGIAHGEATKETIDFIYNYGLCEGTDIFRPLTAILLNENGVKTACVSKTNYKIFLYHKDINASLNQALIDAKLAKPDSNELLDDTFIAKLQASHPELVAGTEQVPDDEDEGNQETNEQQAPAYEIDEDECDLFEFQIGREPVIIPSNKKSSAKRVDKVEPQLGYIPMSAPVAEESATCTPQIMWHQTISNIFLEFQFLENKDFTFKILRNRFTYFESNYKDKNYAWNADLFSAVDKKAKCVSRTRYIEVVLTKVSKEEWPQLLKTNAHCGNIKYKLETLPVSDDEIDPEEKVQRLDAQEIDPKFFKHIEFNKDGDLVEYYSDIEHQDSDYNESSDEDHVTNLC